MSYAKTKIVTKPRNKKRSKGSETDNNVIVSDLLNLASDRNATSGGTKTTDRSRKSTNSYSSSMNKTFTKIYKDIDESERLELRREARIRLAKKAVTVASTTFGIFLFSIVALNFVPAGNQTALSKMESVVGTSILSDTFAGFKNLKDSSADNPGWGDGSKKVANAPDKMIGKANDAKNQLQEHQMKMKQILDDLDSAYEREM